MSPRRGEPAPSVEALVVGNEILAGMTREGNVHHLARSLSSLGIVLRAWGVLGDRDEDLVPFFRGVAGRAGILIVSGGLGPTPDDLTKSALAAALSLPLEEDPGAARELEARYARAGLRFDETALRQVRVPRGATTIPNPVGSAPGVDLTARGTRFFLLPGVPAEFRAMLEETVLPALEAEVPSRVPTHRMVRTIGVPESTLVARLRGLDLAGIEIGYYPHAGGVDLRIAPAPAARPGEGALERALAAVRALLADAAYGVGDQALPAVLGELLAARGATLAVAESCTGGLLGARVTEIPGSSAYFLGGVEAYSDRVKIGLLGVPSSLLGEHGAVSEPVARAMARGARERLGARYAIGVTGIAGPGGGTRDKPVGTVYIGLADEGGDEVRRFRFPGGRGHVRARAAETALDLLRRRLLGILGAAPISHWEHPAATR